MIVNMLVEGPLDEAVAKRVIVAAGHEAGICFPKGGCSFIRNNIARYNKAAAIQPVLALVDFMDTKLECPPAVISEWLPNRDSHMFFRVVVRELESWLLADHENFAAHFKIPAHHLPSEPEKLLDPKQTVISLSSKSRSRAIKEAMIPEQGMSGSTGRGYLSEMLQFVKYTWDIEEARQISPSLNKCLARLAELH